MGKYFRILRENPYQAIAFFLIFIGVATIISYVIMLSNKYSIGNSNIDIEKTGAVGDFVGGFIGTIFSLAGFIIVYLAFIDQKGTNEKEKIENRFFTLIQIHVDNANGIDYKNPYGR